MNNDIGPDIFFAITSRFVCEARSCETRLRIDWAKSVGSSFKGLFLGGPLGFHPYELGLSVADLESRLKVILTKTRYHLTGYEVVWDQSILFQVRFSRGTMFRRLRRSPTVISPRGADHAR